jgi:xanthine dehydrogenase accessory factor
MSGEMRESFADLDRWLGEGEEIALATLVRVRGSAPRPPGARLFVTRSGRMSGSVSGGCVENDILERAQQVLQDGLPVVADYGIADELSFQVGLSCGGSLEVLIEPFREDAAWRAVRDAVEAERPTALAVGLAPRSLRGRRLAIPANGAPVGSIDPELDSRLGAEARRLLPLGETGEVSLPWSDGEAQVFLQAFPPPQRLFIVGATHTAIALCRMARVLGFRVHVVDPRGVFATEERFPEADELVRSWPGEVLQEACLDAWSYVVTLSHDPKFDIPTLAQALRSDACYVGALGSRATQEKRRKQLLDQGFEDAELARIRGPIGLDIGARTPEEIALAILAEMVAVRHGREGAALRRRRAPIHDEG